MPIIVTDELATDELELLLREVAAAADCYPEVRSDLATADVVMGYYAAGTVPIATGSVYFISAAATKP